MHLFKNLIKELEAIEETNVVGDISGYNAPLFFTGQKAETIKNFNTHNKRRTSLETPTKQSVESMVPDAFKGNVDYWNNSKPVGANKKISKINNRDMLNENLDLADMEDKFMEGACGSFALALKDIFGYKIASLDNWGGLNGFTGGHAFCVKDDSIFFKSNEEIIDAKQNNEIIQINPFIIDYHGIRKLKEVLIEFDLKDVSRSEFCDEKSTMKYINCYESSSDNWINNQNFNLAKKIILENKSFYTI